MEIGCAICLVIIQHEDSEVLIRVWHEHLVDVHRVHEDYLIARQSDN